MKQFGINFVNADNAGLLLTINTPEGEIKRRADNEQDVTEFVKKYGISSFAHFSSDMDFATEENFLNDGDAKKMFYAGVEEADIAY